MKKLFEALKVYIDKHFEYEFRSRHGTSYLGCLGGGNKEHKEMIQAWEEVQNALAEVLEEVKDA